MTDSRTVVPSPRRGGVEWGNLDWTVIIAIGAMHLVALLAFWPRLFSWSGLAVGALFFWIGGGIGITLCYHRLLTHRSFKTPKWFEYLLTVCGTLAWQGGPITWVGTHRLHHKHSDTDHDPHSPHHGFTWAHITWTLHKKLEGINARDAAKDLQRDKGLALLDKYFWAPQFGVSAAIFLAGWAVGDAWLGLSWLVWGVAVRTVLLFHCTWFVNSAAHTWGYKNYDDTGENSTNLWWVALVGFGEGWHNNHHAHQRSAAHGLRWFELDMTWWTIKALSWVGLARDIVLPKPEEMPAAVKTAARELEIKKPATPDAPASSPIATLVKPRTT